MHGRSVQSRIRGTNNTLQINFKPKGGRTIKLLDQLKEELKQLTLNGKYKEAAKLQAKIDKLEEELKQWK